MSWTFLENSGTCWFCPSDQCCNLWHCCPYGYVCCPTITLDNTCCISNTNIPWEPGMAWIMNINFQLKEISLRQPAVLQKINVKKKLCNVLMGLWHYIMQMTQMLKGNRTVKENNRREYLVVTKKLRRRNHIGMSFCCIHVINLW